jgi:hypothetical protein
MGLRFDLDHELCVQQESKLELEGHSLRQFINVLKKLKSMENLCGQMDELKNQEI